MKENNEDIYFTTRLGILFILIFLILVFLGSIAQDEPELELIRPQIEVQAQEPAQIPAKSRKELVIQEIINVFGEHSDKAFLLLMGRDNKSCAENRLLNPEAKNDNTQWGGVGIDRGIFQINSYYHPSVSDGCAYDFKCNIRYAKRMFDNDHGSFIRWSCGKHYKI